MLIGRRSGTRAPPGYVDFDLGVVGPLPGGLAPRSRSGPSSRRTARLVEDPVTGSLNASLAGWLVRTGRASFPYVASQGTALGRAGEVYLTSDADGGIWVGGNTVTCVSGEVEL